MARNISITLAGILLCSTLAGCDDGGNKASENDGKAAEKAAEAPAKPVEELFVGDAPQLPPPLAKLEFRQPEADAEAAVPGITTGLMKLEGYPQVRAGSFSIDRGEGKALTNVRITLDETVKDPAAMLTEKWGEPRTLTELRKPVQVWFNAKDGVRARLKPGFGDSFDVEFSAYQPFESLIGTDAAKFGFEDEPLLGLDMAGLHKHYGDVLEVLTKEQAEKKRAQMKKMFGDKIDQLGDAQASTDIHLLPTELESYTTTVWPTFDKETGLIKSVRMTIPFDSEEGAADRMIASMTKVWGEPKEEEKYGKKMYVFSEEPFITVKDSIGKSWEITKSAKRD